MVAFLLLVPGLVLLALRKARRTAWVLTAAGVLCLYLFSVSAVSDRLGRPLQRQAFALAEGQSFARVRWVVVLGGGLEKAPGRPATAWLNESSLERFVEGLRVAHRLDDSRLVFTGGTPGDAHPIAAVEAEAAVALGFPAERIDIRPRARNTREEMEAVAELVGSERFVLVTSIEHLPRAVREARSRGLDPVPDPAGPSSLGRPEGIGAWLPSSDALESSRVALHEVVGRTWYWLTENRR